MSKVYTTKEVANIIKVHPNTIRFYEDIAFITKPKRLDNGYRIYEEYHITECKLIKLAMKAEVIQNGLRKKAIEIVKLCALFSFDEAIKENYRYQEMIKREINHAISASCDVEKILSKSMNINKKKYSRKEVLEMFSMTLDTLRTWERNSLIDVHRKENGHLVYSENDIKKINIIRTLRLANYSISAIHRLLNKLNSSKEEIMIINDIIINDALNTPLENEDIISVCDHLIVSLKETLDDSIQINDIIRNLQKQTLQ